MVEFSQIVVWGYAPDEKKHTHHYIQSSFYKTFKYLGYKTFWANHLSGKDYFTRQRIDIIPNTLFIVEHQRQSNLPLRHDCYYILHNMFWDVEKSWLKFSGWKYPQFEELANSKRVINLQVNRRDYYTPDKPFLDKDKFYYYDLSNYRLFLPWATDLLPHEIEQNKTKVPTILLKKKKHINMIGTIVDTWRSWKQICKAKGYPVNIAGGFTEAISDQENQRLIQESWCSPALQRSDQIKPGYIPCRIFKNISYGVMGITNNQYVQELFNNKLIYNQDLHVLFEKIANWENKSMEIKQNNILELMDIVKNEHTYINRINTIMQFFDMIKN